MSTPPQDGQAMVADWLRILVDPQHAVELRALKCQTRAYRRPHTRSGFFDYEHLDAMARQALALSRDVSRGVYLTLNPVLRDLLSRRCNRVDVAESGTLTTDANIICRRWLLVDADPVRVADVSSTDTEKAAARQTIESVRAYLRQMDWPEPVLADSGNGYHLLCRVDLPVDDGALVERCLKALALQFDSDAVKIDSTVFNPSRIVKLYGTVSRKGDHTPERPHRQSRILDIPDTAMPVPANLLEALAATAPKANETPRRRSRRTIGCAASTIKRAQMYLAALPPAISGQGGHSATFRAACAVVLGFDLTPDDAYPLLAEWNQTHCQPPWNEHELRHKLDDADGKTDERGYLLNASRCRRRSTADRVACGESSDKSHVAGVGATISVTESDQPEIDAGNHDLKTVTAQAWDAVHAANDPPFLFRFGGVPGRRERDDRGEPIIQLVDEDRMRYILARVARWTKQVRHRDDIVTVDAMPPKDVVKDVLATPDMPLPVLLRIVEAPVFARDGTLQGRVLFLVEIQDERPHG